jgi:hypothetical protein
VLYWCEGNYQDIDEDMQHQDERQAQVMEDVMRLTSSMVIMMDDSINQMSILRSLSIINRIMIINEA